MGATAMEGEGGGTFCFHYHFQKSESCYYNSHSSPAVEGKGTFCYHYLVSLLSFIQVSTNGSGNLETTTFSVSVICLFMTSVLHILYRVFFTVPPNQF